MNIENINNQYVLFQISHHTFWGFQYKMHRSELENLTEEDIIKKVSQRGKEKMKSFFKENNLIRLSEMVDEIRLGMHYNNVREEINTADVVYVCGHC